MSAIRLLPSMMAFIILFVATISEQVRGDTIDANTFTYDNPGGPPARSFVLRLTGEGVFVEDPKSSVFPNTSPTINPQVRGDKEVTFSGQMLAPGGSHNVKFKSSGSGPKPRGQFRDKDGNNVGGEVRSKALDGTEVSFLPSGGEFNVTLDLFNDFGSILIGSISVFVNRAGLDHFNLDDFNTLVNPTLVFSDPSYDLASGEGFFGITTQLNSLDEFVLITGTANSDDGFGDFPFAIGISPVETVSIPEPSALILAGLGVLILFGYQPEAPRALTLKPG